ncbi:MAG TPA: phage baseplate assembly protein V [Rhodospirillales bacterium]|nr:phage baseplate assembly protein V [Rhodospirillales bacterium]
MSQLVLDDVVDSRLSLGWGGRFYGAYTALVVDIRDPDGQGRVRVALPWSPDGDGGAYEAWARLATTMAGGNRGTWLVPDVGDEVLVVFEAGDTRRPYVVGALWNGRDAPPERMDGAGRNTAKTIRSRNGVVVSLDDSDGQERLLLQTPGGQQMTLRDGPGSIELRDANGNSVTLDAGGVTVVASARVTVQASSIELSAGTVTVNAGMSRFSGVVQADTVITNSVVSVSYTPGAGNIW